MTKKLLIVGGGYLGAELAKSLENDLEVTLVEQRKAFVHVPAMIRAIVDPSLLNRAFMPYDQLLSKGTIVNGHVISVDKNGVTLKDETRLEADYIVIATGSNNGDSFKPIDENIDAFKQNIFDLHEKLRRSKSVAIVGAGAVGVELAGEIIDQMQEKHITLVSSEESLFPSMPTKFGASITRKLQNKNISIKFGVRADNLESITAASSGTLNLSDGTNLTADLIIPAIGSRGTSRILDTLPSIKRTKNGQVSVDNYLRPSTYNNVFAAGDVAQCGDAMTIVAISRQLPWLTKTLKHLAAGKKLENGKPYTPWKDGKAPLLLPIGPKKGNSFLIIGTFGDWITSALKGRDLFISKYRKLFNLQE